MFSGIVNWGRRTLSRVGLLNVQEELDVLKISSLIHFRERYIKASPAERDSIEFDLLTASYKEQRKYINDTFERELKDLFIDVAQRGGVDPYPAVISGKRNAINTVNVFEEMTERNLDKIPEVEVEKQEKEIVGRPLPHLRGFTLQILYSSIDHPEAGFGAFVTKGLVLPGTVIGLYPGTIFTPDVYAHLNKDSEYMITGYDGTVVDAHGWIESAINMRRKFRQYANLAVSPPGKFQKYRNPYAICNYINHPPKGESPNVIAFSYDFNNQFPKELRPFIPHEHFSPPKWYKGGNLDIRTMVLVATKAIPEGTELYLDYRYNPALPYPEWYYPVDEEVAARRWQGIN